MEAAAAAAARIKTVNAISSSTVGIMSHATKLNQPAWPSTGSRTLALHPRTGSFYHSLLRYPRGTKNRFFFSVHCSTKPGIDSDNATNKNPALGLDSNSKAQKPATSHSDQLLTSTCSRGLVFDLGSKNSWDGAEIGSPIIKRYVGDDEERWYMWYHGRPNGNNTHDSIGLAVSSNGIHWARGAANVRSSADVGMVMTCSRNWWAFDTDSIRPSELVIMSSPMYSAVYWLYYTGFTSDVVDFPGVAKILLQHPERVRSDDKKQENHADGQIFKSLPGLACSQDGRHWARIEGDHHSGALLDVGSRGEWDSLFIAAPQVVVHSNDDIRMYYHSFDVEKSVFSIGVARSRDGIRWVKLGKIMGGGSKGSFDEFGAVNACVVRNHKDENYLMAYEGVGADGKRSIGLAASPDGLKNWKRLQEEAVVEPSDEDGWDNIGVGSPCLVQMGGNAEEWRLYYRGIGQQGRTGIGMAVSQGSEITRLRRWAGFHL